MQNIKTQILFFLALALVITTEVEPTISCDTTDPSYVDVDKFPNLQKQNSQRLCSYTGYVNNSIFYWEFVSNSIYLEEDIPIVIYVNGQSLGQSAILSLFYNNGPLEIVNDKVQYRSNSWIDYSSVVYVDVLNNLGYTTGVTDSALSDIADNIQDVVTLFQQKYPKRKISIYASGYTAKAVLKMQKFIANSIIFDNPMIDTYLNLSTTTEGSIGLGVIGPEYYDVLRTLHVTCANAISSKTDAGRVCQRISDLFEQQSGLDSQDVRMTNTGYTSQSIYNINQYFLTNAEALQTILHTNTKTFDGTNTQVFLEQQQNFGYNCTSLYAKATKQININLIHGEFNLLNGPQSAYQTVMNALGLTPETFPIKQTYATGLLSLTSGEKLGYFHNFSADKSSIQQNLIVLNQGAYSYTWLAQSTELVYNLASGDTNLCYTYNQRHCGLVYGRQQFMNNCNQNGQFNKEQGYCQCKTGYGLADCSLKAQPITAADTLQQTFLPRQWYLFEVKVQDDDIISIIQNIKTTDLEIYVSATGFTYKGELAQYSQNEAGEYHITQTPGTYYLSVRNPSFTTPNQGNIIIKGPGKDDSFWCSNKAGYTLSIVVFVIAMILVLVSIILGLKYRSINKQLNDEKSKYVGIN